jgi:small nuclear ribonucleoprotein (snRNP)-like protein
VVNSKDVTKPKKKAKEKPRKRTEGFSEEYMNKDVIIKLSIGEEVRGRLVEATKYWFKILIGNPNTKAKLESIDDIYINKAYIAYIKPL